MKTKPVMVFLLLPLLLAASCGKRDPEIRTYLEIPRVEPAEEMPALPGTEARPAFAWTCPSGWSEQEGNSIRLATFVPADGSGSFECTLVTFPGDTGGEAANLGRWAGQLGLEADPGMMDRLAAQAVEISCEGGWEGRVFDFSKLPGADGADDASMLATVFHTGAVSIFVKLTGSAGIINREQDSFLALCRSIR